MAVDWKINVLVVDDQTMMLRIERDLLNQIGFRNVDIATSGPDALKKMRGKTYGLVISDWNMVPMTGLELLRQIRSDDQFKTTPVIIVTDESTTENAVAAKRAGVNQYIVKPFSAETLKKKIVSAVGEF